MNTNQPLVFDLIKLFKTLEPLVSMYVLRHYVCLRCICL